MKVKLFEACDKSRDPFFFLFSSDVHLEVELLHFIFLKEMFLAFLEISQ
jgi:hypothetical protein